MNLIDILRTEIFKAASGEYTLAEFQEKVFYFEHETAKEAAPLLAQGQKNYNQILQGLLSEFKSQESFCKTEQKVVPKEKGAA